ncbi:hypothetical protein AB0N73_05265 [Microbacterium sp. NPDC089189]|uniref:hypothetical protein n=1 Tax=Microbacterium sp. NPDC089189 TaxID=3154972 RepID=UPI00343FE345
MNGARFLVAVAVCLLPRARRQTRREEWLADLAGAEELGISRRQVAWGALVSATSEGARAVSPRRIVVVASIAVGAVVVGAPAAAIAVMITESARGVVTTVETTEGTREVFWRDYPGVPELEPSEVLAGPSLEEGEASGRALMQEIEDALSAEFGLEWAPPPTPNGDDIAFPAQNYYGGTSMLSTLNINSRQSTTVPATWGEKERVLAIIAEVAARHGYGELTLDHDRGDMTDAELAEAFGSAIPAESVTVAGSLDGESGQWLWFTITDLSLDRDGRFTEQAEGSEEYGWQPNAISFLYGANALLPEADRAEFERRLEPYAGLTRPEPLPS